MLYVLNRIDFWIEMYIYCKNQPTLRKLCSICFRAVQIENLAMEPSNNAKDIITQKTKKTSLGERKDLAIKLDAYVLIY